ncbi:hypothetical protein DEA8626_03330 [Defluviimonas aquaemixtae]|uniref:Transglutaminase-like domain-containing protein n=1 Tax=Albidovulum aquaemixtae TaxID=1542388 RepID=A0A2R8BLN0_9RHOB|nr:transglutaminase family protein [Defluviimonas aquaemixtae]SPH24280.1 hypothetical protein DEA8626_03330 [Defluviimonas aquaemixtae]
MTLLIRHITSYRFESPPNYGLQQLRKTPKSGRGQTVVSWSTEVVGGRKELSFEDHHHNTVDLVSFDGSANEIVITSFGEVAVDQTDGVVGPSFGPSPLWLYLRESPATKFGRGSRSLVQEVEDGPNLERLHGLSRVVREAIEYQPGVSLADWTAEDAISHGRGVCQDHTQVFLSCARMMGFSARYVSGYLMLNDRVDQEAMHAWAEAHVDGLGWVGFDISNGISPDARYVRVATGLDYKDAAPVTGMHVGGNSETLSVEIQVAQQ